MATSLCASFKDGYTFKPLLHGLMIGYHNTTKEPGKRAYIGLESCSYRILLFSSLPFPWLYLMPGLMLLAVEDIAIEDHVYYDNRFGLVLPSGCRLPSPASVSFC